MLCKVPRPPAQQSHLQAQSRCCHPYRGCGRCISTRKECSTRHSVPPVRHGRDRPRRLWEPCKMVIRTPRRRHVVVGCIDGVSFKHFCRPQGAAVWRCCQLRTRLNAILLNRDEEQIPHTSLRLYHCGTACRHCSNRDFGRVASSSGPKSPSGGRPNR